MAIIVVLAAVAIPTFGRQLETARETGDMEIIRAAYTEALSMAVLDAADGKMDGKNGGTQLGTAVTTAVAANAAAVAGSTTITATPITDKEDEQFRYTVTLEKMDSKAKIKQTGSNWQYVNNEIVGVTVPPVLATKGDTDGTAVVAFNFEMQTDGNVRLLATNGITVDVPS